MGRELAFHGYQSDMSIYFLPRTDQRYQRASYSKLKLWIAHTSLNSHTIYTLVTSSQAQYRHTHTHSHTTFNIITLDLHFLSDICLFNRTRSLKLTKWHTYSIHQGLCVTHNNNILGRYSYVKSTLGYWKYSACMLYGLLNQPGNGMIHEWKMIVYCLS